MPRGQRSGPPSKSQNALLAKDPTDIANSTNEVVGPDRDVTTASDQSHLPELDNSTASIVRAIQDELAESIRENREWREKMCRECEKQFSQVNQRLDLIQRSVCRILALQPEGPNSKQSKTQCDLADLNNAIDYTHEQELTQPQVPEQPLVRGPPQEPLEQAQPQQEPLLQVPPQVPLETLAEDSLPDSDTPAENAILSKNPRTLQELWQEYQFGIAGRKPAKLFTPQERGKNKHKYHRRKVAWDMIAKLVRAGHTPQAAIVRIYSVYGPSTSMTRILNMMKNDKKLGGNPQLKV